jgi:hypothetical protein
MKSQLPRIPFIRIYGIQLLLLRKLALEVPFNAFPTERFSCFGQYDRIHDLVTFKLRGEECSVFR